jgi:hypothetical protein
VAATEYRRKIYSTTTHRRTGRRRLRHRAYSQQTTGAPNDDPKRVLVGRLDLERYKATLRGLGQYGDRD